VPSTENKYGQLIKPCRLSLCHDTWGIKDEADKKVGEVSTKSKGHSNAMEKMKKLLYPGLLRERC